MDRADREPEVPDVHLEADRKGLVWVLGPDVGESSIALLALILNIPRTDVKNAVPMDCWDFGRCMRMLKEVGIRENIHWLVEDPLWGPYIWEWEALEAVAENASLNMELYPTDHDFQEVANARSELNTMLYALYERARPQRSGE